MALANTDARFKNQSELNDAQKFYFDEGYTKLQVSLELERILNNNNVFTEYDNGTIS